MSRDVTILGVDVPEETVRRALRLVPGVEPLPPDEVPDDEGAAGGVGDQPGGREAGAGSADGEAGPRAGDAAGPRRSDEAGAKAETDAGSQSAGEGGPASRERSGSRSGGSGGTRSSTHTGAGPPEDARWGPDLSSPWPGAPKRDGPDPGSGGLSKVKMAAIGVGLVMTLGILGLGIFLAVRKVRGRRDSGRVRMSGDPDPAEPESHETGAFGREFPSGTLSIDFKPVIGVGFLVALAVLVRRLYGD